MESCPTCAKEFKTSAAVKTHHTQAHGDSLVGNSREKCDGCGGSYTDLTNHYYRNPSHKPDDWKNCPECGERFETDRALSQHLSSNHSKNTGVVVVECDICGNETEKRAQQVDKTEHSVCSQDCLSELHSTVYVGEDAPAYKGAKTTEKCPWCGEKNKVYESAGRAGFCDRRCYGEWLSENKSGENHARWKGGSPNHYGSNWNRQRKKALERDGDICQVCGMGHDEHKEKHGEQLHVHHITPIRKHDEPEQANYLENLVTLCEGCHNRWEGIPLRPQ